MTGPDLLEVLVSYAVKVLILIVVCTLIERLLPRVQDRCRLWSCCFLGVLFLGVAAFALPRLHLIQPWSRLQASTILTLHSVQATLGKALLMLWLLGASTTLIAWCWNGLLLRRVLRRCERLSADETDCALRNIAKGGVENITVLVSDECGSPFCWQLHQPTVVVPRFLLEGDHADLHNVLVHEIEHLKTHHPLQLFLQNLAQVVCWFHPSIRTAGARVSLLRELTCDEAVAKQGADCAQYLHTLLRIAEHCKQSWLASTVGFSRSRSEIVVRAERLVQLAMQPESLETPQRRFGAKSAGCVLGAIICALCLVWIPCNALASTRSIWSPWPTWTAKVVHCFGYTLRDYEHYDRHSQRFEVERETRGITR